MTKKILKHLFSWTIMKTFGTKFRRFRINDKI